MEQRKWLRDAGCPLYEGDPLSRPMPAAEVTAWLETRESGRREKEAPMGGESS